MKRIEIYSIIVGIVFIVSAFAKALSISHFAKIIADYGFENLQFLSIFIVFVEALLGLALIFQIYLKQTSSIGILLLTFFTIIYAYGLIFMDIKDCGCFGNISILNTSPIFIFIRNAVLTYMLVFIWVFGRAQTKELNSTIKFIIAVIFFAMCTIAFISGYNYQYVNKNNENRIISIKDSALKDIVNISKDSTYFIFAFSYNCPHCLNSIANLKEYKETNIADNIIALALGDTIIEEAFTEIFKPNFPIRNYAKELLKLTNTFPKAYYIRQDSIIVELSGELPCAYLFKKLHLQ
ncbi:MAG: hypothetical protein LBG17_08915 [Bacteroidales bacterium]|nr:hypothetical protein [Bacteroidales bacterium]